ncbi:DUF397 domain-containing protein [Streptomyces hoynatensis]|uniref:DUF397 domain-containing protein n=1 Tax=Streptomyces hoynatensis TaxID=1141874 RepID=A0A3A9Z9Z8_9ACTN|nr:DUF397 domain-containing protein [Streptomyces hoynatensis]
MDSETEPRWRKSSYSGSGGGDCVEVSAAAAVIRVRDSKNADGPQLRFGREGWAAFLAQTAR